MNEIICPPISMTTVVNVKKLTSILHLLDTFHKSEIIYCHWKSNEHLDASMIADTDLDILFDSKQQQRLETILAELDFKKFVSTKQKKYKDIEDFICMDLPSGKIIHLHAHFRLTMGERYLKSYQLNLVEKILCRRVFDVKFGIYRIDPTFEIILLYFREALKIRHRDIIKMYLSNKVRCQGSVLKEYYWLKEKRTEHAIECLLKEIFNDYMPIYKIVTGPLERKKLFKLSGLLKRELKSQRMLSPLKALMLRWGRELSIMAVRKFSRVLNSPIVSLRVNPRGGLVIAVIGVDGSGKSTVISNLHSTFKKKLDVYRIYLGQGNGEMSWLRKLFVESKRVFTSASTKQAGKKVEGDGLICKRPNFKKTLYKSIEALLVALEKRRNLRRMIAAKKKGMLVICDRFPQNQVMGYNDGPKLNGLTKSSNPILKAMSKMEARVYAFAEENPPDLVFKLIANAEVVSARKPGETSLEMLETKIEGINNLKFSGCCKVVNVDATKSLESVIYTINREIWNAYP